MKANAADIWRLYKSTQLHFQNTSYDAFKYKFRSKSLTQSRFETSKSRFLFIAAERHNRRSVDWLYYFYSNILYRNEYRFERMNENPFDEFRKRTESLAYRYKQDLAKFDIKLNDLLYSGPYELPPIIQAEKAGEIMIETVIILDILTNFINAIEINDTLLWPEFKGLYTKARPFVERKIISIEKFKSVTLQREPI